MGKTNNEWTVCDKGNVYSNDFTHDVMLIVNGDFENLAQKREYAKKLAGMLNGQGVPGGWQLVPKEPTPEMIGELRLTSDFNDAAIGFRYKAMLAASPTYTGETE